MPDTMTLTKIVGSLCGALLIFLFGNWAGEALYSVGGGHGEEEQAYVIDTGKEEAAPAEEDSAPSFAAVYASADAAAGESVFNQCVACHKASEVTNGVGPHLVGVVGRKIASVEGYGYSDALAGLEGEWTPEELDPWLENPAGYAPGNKMGFAGIGDIEERANLIAYLQTFEGDPAMAPSAYEGKAAAETADAGGAGADAAETAAASGEGGASATDTAGGAPDGGGGFAAMVAEADPARGEELFARCTACHKLEPGAHGVGPSLYDIVGSDIAAAEGYSYSEALKGLEGNWTPAKLKDWIAAPMEMAPGTRMPPAGVTAEEDIAAVIAYLRAQGPEEEASAGAGDSGTQTAAAGGASGGASTAAAAGDSGSDGDQGASTAEAEGGGFAAKVAAADPAAGKTLFSRCAVCHSVEPGRNMIGPSLFGVMGRDIASVEGFDYSNAIKGLEGNWTPAKLKQWVTDPTDLAPDTYMPPPGVTAEGDLAAVIAYLDSLDD